MPSVGRQRRAVIIFDTYRDGLELRMATLIRVVAKLIWLPLMMLGISCFAKGQDLAPRAYVITPLHSNAVILTWGFYDGGINVSGSIPVAASGVYNVPVVSYYHSLNFFGRSANVTAWLPYGVGTFEAAALGRQKSAYRSGLLDVGVRLSVNLKGGPAMTTRQFADWKQKTLLGVSLRVIAPTGQYSSTQLITWGINRWVFKPEFGYSRRRRNWVLDAYAGAWFYTTNPADFHVPHPAPQTEEPIGSFEGHLSRDFGRGTWVSVDGNFWWGGVTTLDGIRNPATRQTSSRIGATAALRISKHQSVKFSYSCGAYVRFGGDYQNVSIAWQYSWVGRP
jgi:hypothetical protein